MPGDLPTSATVVVATRNRAALLARLVVALEAQEGAPPFEVVIVDDASTDDTGRVLGELASRSTLALTILRQEVRRGPAAARNRGWRAGLGAAVLFTDDDCVPHPRWIAELAGSLADHDLVQGTTIPAPDQSAGAGPFSRTLEVRSATGYFQTANMGFRRAALGGVGGFDESFAFPAGEDTDLALRCLDAGGRFAFVAGAVVEHDVRPSSAIAAVRDTWRWQGVVAAVKRHPDLHRLVGSRWFWRPSHPPTMAAVAGVALAAVAVAGRSRRGLTFAALLSLPWLRHRLVVAPVAPRRREAMRALVPQFAVDAGEVLALAVGSVKERYLFL